MSVSGFFHFLLCQDKMECDQQIVLKTIEAESEDRVQEGNLLARRIPAYMKRLRKSSVRAFMAVLKLFCVGQHK